MELLLKRSQKEAGLMGGKVHFILDAKVRMTESERASIKRYGLGDQLVYNSEASQKHVSAAQSHMSGGTTVGHLRALGAFALASMKLNIRVKDLETGVHIECKTLDEAVGAEHAIQDACQNLLGYVSTASHYNGQEQVVPIAVAPSA